ncbi:MAG: pyridoxamine 5'-phosphate oxidase family protein [Planctomycetes bacterium]|nr:pyridoxamine 5'-phosphate oxidase family protein [Planctomycetota bacterium]
MKMFSLLMTGVFACGLLGCGNPSTAPAKTPAAPVIKAQPDPAKAPDFYKGDLSWREIEYILHSSSVGRIISFGEQYPYSVPVSFVYFEGKVVIHSSPRGTKINNIKKNQSVCFAVDRYNEREGWASINIFGQASVVADPARKGELMAKFEAAYTASPDMVETAVAKMQFKPVDVPVAMIEIAPDKIANRVLSVPRDWLLKFPYIAGQIPGENVLPTGAHGASTKPMPAELIDWTLYSCSAGRLDTLAAGYPDSTPVNYAYFDGKVYVHSRNYGSKVTNISKDQRVAFSVDRFNKERWLSVNVSGTARLITDPAEMALLMNKYTVAFNTTEIDKIPEAVKAVIAPEERINKSVGRMAEKMVLIEITPNQITGRMNNVKLNVVKLPYTLKDNLRPEQE